VGAVTTLLAGISSVLITRKEGRIVPVPFADLLDPLTGRSRVREVDVEADSYANAFALQERIFAEDLEDPARLASIAEAAKLSPDEARERYAPR
jgi:6-phosphofructokinase 1